MSIKVDGIVDDDNCLWVYWKGCLVYVPDGLHRFGSIDDAVEWLKDSGFIKPDPLEEALDAAKKTWWDGMTQKGCEGYASDLLRKLHADLTEGE